MPAAAVGRLSERARVLIIIVLANLPLVALLLLSLWRLVLDAEAQVTRDQVGLARAAAATTGTIVESSLGTLRSVAQAPALRERGGDADRGDFFRRLQAENPEWDFLGFFDTDGWAISGAGIQPRSLNVADRDYFQDVLTTGRPVISTAFISRLRGIPVVILAVPVEFADGGRGVLAAGLALDRLATELRGLAESRRASVVVVDAEGQTFIHPDPEVARSLPLARGRPEVDAALGGEAGSRITTGPDGTELLTAYVPVPAARWGLLVVEPTAVAFDAIRRQLAIALGLFALAATFAGLIGWYLGGRLSHSYRREREARAQAESVAHVLEAVSLESEQRRRFLEQLIETAPVAIAILRGPEHRYEAVNSRYQLLHAGTDLLNRPFAATLQGEQDERIAEILDAVYASGEPYTAADLPFMSLDGGAGGEPRYFTLGIARYEDEVGQPEGMLIIAVETTDEVLARRRSEREKDEFLSVASHELKTPLSALSLATQLVERMLTRGTLDPERLERHIASISTQVARATRLISDLLDVSRIRAGSLQLRLEPVDLGSLSRAAVERERDALADDAHHTIKLAVDPEADLVVEGDEARLDQVLTNLLSNAVKYSPDGGTVTVGLTRQDDQILLSVADEGIGIPEDEREQVFSPFGRTAAARVSGVEGTGLGLYITRRIVEAHGGTIAVADSPGQGTTFVVRLPLGQLAAPSEPELVEAA